MSRAGPIVALNGGNVYRVASHDQEPSTNITTWRFVQVKHGDGDVQRHLLGNVLGEGRVSTGATRIDLATMKVTTESGRVYGICGSPGRTKTQRFFTHTGSRLEDEWSLKIYREDYSDYVECASDRMAPHQERSMSLQR